jgi:CheY-like chemotaxis protein
LTFVLVQRLSPDFKSLMGDLLARRTKVAIHRVQHGMPIERDAIYLIPPKTDMTLSCGRLWLSELDHKPGNNMPIDIFLTSLAQDMGNRAIAVILSGTGSDGSRGVREIHEKGGLVVIQDPDTARFDSMPRAAIGTGVEGLAAILAKHPDLALVDIGLPGLSGYDVARPVRADPATAKIRLIALTGHGRAADHRKAREAGFDEHIVKPLRREALMRVLRGEPPDATEADAEGKQPGNG